MMVFKWLIPYIACTAALCGSAWATELPKPSCQNALQNTASTKELSLFTLAYHLAHTRDIHLLTDKLEAIHGVKNFKIPIPLTGKNIFIFQDRERVSAVMKRQANLSFVNKNFDISHGHFNSINSVNTTDDLWKDLHSELQDIFKNKKISPIMEKYRGMLTANSEVNLNGLLEEYFLRVWSEYSFGPVDIDAFKNVRHLLIETLGKVFHQNKLNRLPGVGWITSKLNYRKYRTQLDAVDRGLSAILDQAIAHKQGAFYELYERLKDKYPNAKQIALDNSFLGVLVYDFIYIIMLDAATHMAQTPAADRAKIVRKSMHDGFLYPFRFRVPEESFDDVQKGDYCVVNMQKSGLYFSYGERACPGAGIFQEIARKFQEIYKDYDLCLVDPAQPITYNGSKDIPIMTSTHQVRVCPFHKKAEEK